MAIASPERESMAELLALAQEGGLGDRKRFEFTPITELSDPAGVEGITPIFFRQTDYVPATIGHKVVAKFTEKGPAVSLDDSLDMIRPAADQAVLVRRVNESEAKAIPAGMLSRAWVLELIVPDLDEPSTARRTGIKTQFINRVG